MKLVRYSGKPVELDHIQGFLDETQVAFDKLEAEMGKCTQDNADVFRQKLELNEANLYNKYPLSKSINYPKTKKAISTLIQQYGPICFLEEDGELCAMIMDA